MADEKKARIAAFVKDLEELSRKHGLAIDGCGCCGSPYLIDLPKKGGYTYEDGGLTVMWDEDK